MALDKITTGIINDDAVTAAKIVAGAVGTSEIADGTVVAADIAANSVGTSEIADSVTLVTPNIGTPSAGVVTNLSGVLPSGVTGGSGLTALGTVTAGNLSNTAIVYPAGHIVQVKQLVDNETDSTTSTDYVDIGTSLGFTLAITPSSASNKILVLMQFWMTTEGPYVWSKLVRSGGASGDGAIYKGVAAGSATGVSTSGKSSGGENSVNQSLIYLDSPAVTSAVTYKLQWKQRSSGTGRFNTHNDGGTSSATQPLFSSTITLMEVVD
jgi:hypothetical protein